MKTACPITTSTCLPPAVRGQSGFTLIEVMVAVVIVAILTAVALPSYRDYVIRGKLPEATSALLLKRTQMEQFYLDRRTFEDAPACAADTTSNSNFDFACEADADSYTLTATGKGSMSGFEFTLDQSNNKATTAVPAGWTSSSNCWVRSRGGC